MERNAITGEREKFFPSRKRQRRTCVPTIVAISSALVVFIEPVAGAEPSTLGPCTAPQTSLPDPATKGRPERRRARLQRRALAGGVTGVL